jgi:cytochrome b
MARWSESYERAPMSAVGNTVVAGTGGEAPPATVQVWDPFVRIFHWSLVVLFAIAFLTGDEVEQAHVAAGYAIGGLLALRIAWGFVGPRHARFADFVRPPRAVIAYLRDAMAFRSRRHLGHNPAGGLMALVLIGMLIGTCATGYLMTTDAYWGSEAMEHVHGAFASVTVALVALHVLGALATSLAHGENLVKAMITGRKRAG